METICKTKNMQKGQRQLKDGQSPIAHEEAKEYYETMAKMKWSRDSIEDLKEICRFIALDSPYCVEAALRDRF